MTGFAIALLLAKLGLAAAVVVVASLVVERSGPVVGALLTSLPLGSAPTYVFLALDHDAGFLAQVALGSLPAMVGIAAFQLAYVHLAQRRGVLASVAGGMLAWLLVAAPLRQAGLGIAVLGPLAVAGFALCAVLVRPLLRWSGRNRPRRRWWDIPFRAGIVALTTGAALLAGQLVGPGLAGLVTLMPTVFVPMALILHPRIGGPDTATVIGTAAPGMIGLALMQNAICLTAVGLGSAGALLLGVGISLGWNMGLFVLQRRR